MATKIKPEIRGLSYREWIAAMNLPTLEERRNEVDKIKGF